MGTIPKILIFDSGVGGLSILQEIRKQLPFCEYIYACDNEAFPYGTKKEGDLIHRVDQVLKTLIRKVEPDIIIVACNTASTVVLPHIRSHFNKPVVGVVPAIKPAANSSNSKTIGLLGTPGTVSRQYTLQLIKDFANHCTVIKVGSGEMVELAEAKLRGEPIDRQRLSGIIAPFFKNAALDTIVLACTHFPLLIEELQDTSPWTVNWIDSADAIARRVRSLLPEQIGIPSTQSAFETGFLCIVTAEHSQNTALMQQLTLLGCKEMRTFII